MRLNSLLLFFVLTAAVSGCATKEIQRLQASISELETKVQQYQRQASRDTAQTAATLQDVNQAVRESFKELGYTQSTLEETLNQISERLATLERDVAQLQERAGRQEEFSNQNATLTQQVQEQANQLSAQIDALNGELERTISDLAAFKRESEHANQQNRAQINRVRDALTQQIAEMESSTREMYTRILNELGASVPQPQEVTSEASGQVHVVKSGETLSAIAQHYGVSVRALQEYNGISDPSLIVVGQKIRIP